MHCCLGRFESIMTYTISPLSVSDIDGVDHLMKRNSQTLGFLPYAALHQALDSGDVLGAHHQKDGLVGYLLFARYEERVRIAHLCVAKDHRGTGLSRRLFDALKDTCTTQRVIRLNCRRDYDAHYLWPKLGFVPMDEKVGKSHDGKLLTCWEHRLKEDKQIDIFKERMSDQAIKVVIDAQILFHFEEPDSDESLPSKALLADYLTGQIALSLTDEIFLEVDRQCDAGRRERSRGLANLYPSIPYDRDVASHHEAVLASIFKPRSASDWSDVRHLAKTAASDVRLFVTRDEDILDRSTEVRELFDLEVISPIDLIMRLHRQLDPRSYSPSTISGQALAWRRAKEGDLGELVAALRRPDEPKGKYREMLQRYLARPDTYSVDVLVRGDEILGAKASTAKTRVLTVFLVRAARSPAELLVEQFMVSDTLALCVAKDLHAVRLKRIGLSEPLRALLPRMGFESTESDYHRLCTTEPVNYDEIPQLAKQYFPSSFEAWGGLTHEDALLRCSPMPLSDVEEKCILVPIRPGYAMSLFDKKGAEADLFGGKSDILMRWENVYFRRKTHHMVLRPPARILWYESGDTKAITANSQLLSVEIGTAKSLFTKRRRYGTLEWSDIFEMCDGDVHRELMTLTFSHTFSFRYPISLDSLRRVEGRKAVPLQSPRLIPYGQFLTIMNLGYRGCEE